MTLDSTAVLEENGPDVWGKAWYDLGMVDLTELGQLHVTVGEFSGESTILALSGAYDANYTEFLSVTNAGDYAVDVTSWAGNVPGEEQVFLQFIIVGEGAAARYTRILLEQVQ